MMAGRSKPRKPLLIAPSRIAVRASTDVLAIADPIVVQATRFIRLFACKGINVEHVADHLILSRRTLERRFRVSLNSTLNEEILPVKIDHAKMLLTQNNYPTKRISSLSGSAHCTISLGPSPASLARLLASIVYEHIIPLIHLFNSKCSCGFSNLTRHSRNLAISDSALRRRF